MKKERDIVAYFEKRTPRELSCCERIELLLTSLSQAPWFQKDGPPSDWSLDVTWVQARYGQPPVSDLSCPKWAKWAALFAPSKAEAIYLPEIELKLWQERKLMPAQVPLELITDADVLELRREHPQKRIKDLRIALKDGQKIPPLILGYYRHEGILYIIDGWLRFTACRETGSTHLDAFIVEANPASTKCMAFDEESLGSAGSVYSRSVKKALVFLFFDSALKSHQLEFPNLSIEEILAKRAWNSDLSCERISRFVGVCKKTVERLRKSWAVDRGYATAVADETFEAKWNPSASHPFRIQIVRRLLKRLFPEADGQKITSMLELLDRLSKQG